MEAASITTVKGIGDKTAKLFARLGVETVEDLLHYYPRAYDTFLEPKPVSGLKEDAMEAVEGMLSKMCIRDRFRVHRRFHRSCVR